jgi:F0F1-type ATP synthase membrane subunit b/b'
MTEFLDTLTRLIIAILSFLAPVVVFLLNVFHKGITLLSKQYEVETKQIQELIRQQAATPDGKFSEIMTKSTKELRKSEKKAQRIKNRLNPKRQVRLLFLPLIASITLLMIDFLIRGNVLNLYNHNLSCVLITLALLSFLCACYVIKNTTWAIIEAKQSIDENETAVTLKPSQE